MLLVFLFPVDWLTAGGAKIAQSPMASSCAPSPCVSWIQEMSTLPITSRPLVSSLLSQLRMSSTFVDVMRIRLPPDRILISLLMLVFQFRILLWGLVQYSGIYVKCSRWGICTGGKSTRIVCGRSYRLVLSELLRWGLFRPVQCHYHSAFFGLNIVVQSLPVDMFVLAQCI